MHLTNFSATSTHTWSDKTLCYFPAILRDALIGRIDKRALAIQAWQQVSVNEFYLFIFVVHCVFVSEFDVLNFFLCIFSINK